LQPGSLVWLRRHDGKNSDHLKPWMEKHVSLVEGIEFYREKL